jgi:hypothetical protein
VTSTLSTLQALTAKGNTRTAAQKVSCGHFDHMDKDVKNSFIEDLIRNSRNLEKSSWKKASHAIADHMWIA